MNYQYPDNLRAKATLWLWELKHITITGISLLLSILIFSQIGILLPLVGTALLAFLTIRMEDMTILDYLKNSFGFFIRKQQLYKWGEKD